MFIRQRWSVSGSFQTSRNTTGGDRDAATVCLHLSAAFPTPLPEKTRIKVQRELRLRRHATSAALESVKIPVTIVLGSWLR
jgi:hypothetical protein